MAFEFSRMTSDNWYAAVSAGIDGDMWEKAGTPEWTRADVVFLKAVLNLKTGDKVNNVEFAGKRDCRT